MKILKEILGDCLKVGNQINKKFLSDWQKEIFSEYLDLLDLSTANNYLLLALNLRASQMLCNNWITVELNSKTNVPINLYAISLMPTGAGKDSTVKRLDDFIFNKFNKMFEKQSEGYIEVANKRIRAFAEETFDGKAEKDKYIRANFPRLIDQDLGTATTEGLIDMREAMESAGFGCTSLVIGELGTYILNQNNDIGLLETYLHIYDFGNSSVKLIKGDRRAKAVKGVPATMMLYSSPEKLGDGPGKEKLKSFLNQGFARRTFMCIPEKDEFNSNKKKIQNLNNIEDYKRYKVEKLRNENIAYKNAEKISEKMLEIYIDTKPEITEKFSPMVLGKFDEEKLYKKIKFSEEARFIYEAYFDYCKNSVDIFDTGKEEGVTGEITNRSWKALKLAGVIASMEHSKDLTIHEQDIKNAIYQTEYFGQHIDRFYYKKLQDDVDKLFNFFLENLGKKISKSDVRGERIVGQNKFSAWFNGAIEELFEHATMNGYKLIAKSEKIDGTNKPVKFYKLEKIDDDDF